MGVYPVHHEGGDGARGIVFARIAGGLKVIQNLFVDVAEMLAFAQVVEIHGIDLVDHLPHQLAGFHVIIGVFKNILHHAAPVPREGGCGQIFQCWKQIGIDEAKKLLTRDAFRVGGPVAPLVLRRDGGTVVALQQFQFLVLIVYDF